VPQSRRTTLAERPSGQTSQEAFAGATGGLAHVNLLTALGPRQCHPKNPGAQCFPPKPHSAISACSTNCGVAVASRSPFSAISGKDTASDPQPARGFSSAMVTLFMLPLRGQNRVATTLYLRRHHQCNISHSFQILNRLMAASSSRFGGVSEGLHP
jgi:hypothetical protein